MRTVTVELEKLYTTVINIGFMGEQEHTNVEFRCDALFREYPNAQAYATLKAQVGDAYPVVLTRSGSTLIWAVDTSDLVYAGVGQLQLTFSQGNEIIKTVIGKYRVNASLEASGEAPDPVENWIDQAGETLEEVEAALTAIPETIDAALQEAKESGEFDGPPGEDGFSPVANVTKSGKTATITITDKAGTTTAQVTDGADGTDIIDDTAGAGDTDKTWSANRLRGVQDLVALPYEELTFPVAMNALCVHDGKLYKSITAIQTEEAWTPSHWYDVTGGESVTALYTGLDTIGAALAQKYSKPAGGIPASDIAAGVIPDPADLIDDEAGAGDTDKVWSADKSASEKSSTMSALNSKYEKPASGIPASDLASGVIPSVPVQDVQVNGTSVLSQGVANVQPLAIDSYGVAKIGYSSQSGLELASNGILKVSKANDNAIKEGTATVTPIVPFNQHTSVFYALAKLAGADMKNLSGETVGVYPEAQKRAICAMLGVKYDEPYRFINEVTITDADTSYVLFETDTNGDAFSLHDVIIDFDLTVASGSSLGLIIPNISTAPNSASDIPYLSALYLFHATNAQRRVARLHVEGGRFFGECENDRLPNDYNTVNTQRNRNATGIYECDSITKLRIYSINAHKFGNGSKIKVYGR